MCQYGAKAKQVLYTQRLGSILKPLKNGHGKTTTRNDYFKSVLFYKRSQCCHKKIPMIYLNQRTMGNKSGARSISLSHIKIGNRKKDWIGCDDVVGWGSEK
jgi:hypothetical protein